MVHARRKSVDVYESEGSAIVEESKRTAALHAVEKEARHKPAEECVALRQAKTKPVFDDLEAWLSLQLPKITGKSTLAAAVRYGLGRMPKARAYLKNSELELDDNSFERCDQTGDSGAQELSVHVINGRRGCRLHPH